MSNKWSESSHLMRFRRPYKQPKFHDTHHAENADNVRYALHHISKPALLKRYENPVGYNEETGRADRGEHTEYSIWMEIQPLESGEDSKLLSEGERIEADYEFWIDPHHPKHIELHNKPIYLRQSDSRFVTGDGFNANANGGHADIIFWMGENYIIRRLRNWQSASHEEGNGHFTGYQAGVLVLWRDNNQERESNKNNVGYEYG